MSESAAEMSVSGLHHISMKSQKRTYRKMLAKVQIKTIYGAIVKDGKITACASAAIDQGYMLLQTNEVAYNLYNKLDYKKVYTYWYMKKEVY